MTKLTLNSTQIATLVGARANVSTQSAVKKAIFTAVRSAYRIPTSIKLKVEIDNQRDAAFGVLKDKATGYALLADSYGRYSRLDTITAPTATASAQGAVMVSNPGTAAPTAVVRKVSRAALLAVLRNTGQGITHTGNHPVLASVDSVGLDTSTGDLYYRAR